MLRSTIVLYLCTYKFWLVAEFIVQSESARDIEEALKILIAWNPEWNPNYFMTDFSEAEILAPETSFPNTNVYLCDFHREQAWERWVKDGSHGLNSAEQDWLLNQLRACAWAPSAIQRKVYFLITTTRKLLLHCSHQICGKIIDKSSHG